MDVLTLTVFVLEGVHILLQPPPDLLGASALPQILLDPLLVLLVAVAVGGHGDLQVDVLHVRVFLAQVRHADLARDLNGKHGARVVQVLCGLLRNPSCSRAAQLVSKLLTRVAPQIAYSCSDQVQRSSPESR